MTQREILPTIAIIGLLIWGASSTIQCYYQGIDRETYNRAQIIAEKKYGDKQAPLTEEEKKEWYKDMQTSGDKPSYNQLEKFVESNK